jgi:hypothetical protein
LYSYREYTDLQRKSLETSDERLERKNIDILRYLHALNRKELEKKEPDMKIYIDQKKS